MRKRAIWTTALCCAMGFSLAACVPNVEGEGDGQSRVVAGSDLPDDATLQDRIDKVQSDVEAYAPEVRTLEDGTSIQLTPDAASNQFGLNHLNGAPAAYNTQYLNADNRGCVSCHEDGLADLVNNKMDYPHIKITNNLGSDVTPMQCVHCHSEDGYSNSYDSFGSLIHGMHSRDSFKGSCLSCHDATDNGTMRLWEEAKYDVLRGFTYVENAQGRFSYEQETLTDLPQIDWMLATLDDAEVESLVKGSNGESLDSESLINDWDITVSGEVDNPVSVNLGELIKEAPSETFVTGAQCVINPEGGELIANMEITGIPMSYVLDKAGVKEGANVIYPTAPSGYTQALPVEGAENGEIYLVYKLNGEYLTYEEGAPVMVWDTDLRCLGNHTRFVSEVVVASVPEEEVHFYNGLPDREGNYFDKPNAGITNFHDGQIVEVGKPFDFTGFAQAFDEQIVAVEFSLDQGETWTTFDTSDSDETKVVWWTFAYTPEKAGSYVMSIRAVSDTGKVSPYPIKVMFNAK